MGDRRRAAGQGAVDDSKMESQEDDDMYLEPAVDPFAPQPASLSSASSDGTVGASGVAQKSRRRRLGVLQSVPMVAPSNEHLASALKRANRVSMCAHGMGGCLVGVLERKPRQTYAAGPNRQRRFKH
jgi:hypothetical protein